MKTVILSLLFCMISTVPLLAMGNLPSNVVNDPLIGKPAPEYTLNRLKGEPSNFTTARNGQKAILIFWATWCPHCREELERLRTTLGEIEQKGIKVLLVDMGETTAEVKAYFDHQGYDFNTFLDEDNALQDPYHIVGVPTVVFINEKGTITHISHEVPNDLTPYFNGV